MSRTIADQTKLSGCSSFESSLESTTLEPVRPLPAIKNMQRFADPQPSTSVSPIIRRVLSEFDIRVEERVAAAVNTMMHTFVMPKTELQQTVQPDLPRAATESDNIDLDNTILLSQYVLVNFANFFNKICKHLKLFRILAQK